MKPALRATTVTHESIDRFLSSLSARGRSELTLKAYRSDLKALMKWHVDTCESPESLAPGVGSLEVEDFEDQAMLWLNQGRNTLAPTTTSRRLATCKTFGRWVGLGVILDEYSAPTAARPIPHPLPEGMEGVRRMIAAANSPTHRALVAFGGMMGCRISETLAIESGNFDLREMVLMIRGKGDKRRIVPISTEAWSVVQRPVLDAVLAGPSTRVVPLQDRNARNVITQLGLRAGMSRTVSSHDLRATFATAVYDKSKDPRAVQELLGHSNITTTEGYIGVKLETMRSVVEL